jgi:5,10-methylene-tetrahydrofolate dehydrogenase/methenyl tetrahydrofolate cyclohydrolase
LYALRLHDPLRDTGENLVGKHAVVIGQSNIVELLMARCTT